MRGRGSASSRARRGEEKRARTVRPASRLGTWPRRPGLVRQRVPGIPGGWRVTTRPLRGWEGLPEAGKARHPSFLLASSPHPEPAGAAIPYGNDRMETRRSSFSECNSLRSASGNSRGQRQPWGRRDAPPRDPDVPLSSDLPRWMEKVWLAGEMSPATCTARE